MVELLPESEWKGAADDVVDSDSELEIATCSVHFC